MPTFIENYRLYITQLIQKLLYIGTCIYPLLNCLSNAAWITLVNTQIFAEDISTVLRYIRCADSENGLILAELALVFEINAFFMKILLK